MKINDDILQELAEIAPKLASLNRINYFAVPEGYFVDGLPESFTLTDLKAAGLDNSKDQSPFIKPVEDDADLTYLNVISEIIIEPYLYLRDAPLYKVPEHYFDILPTLLINEVSGEMLLPNQLNQNTNQTQYKIPDNYFNELQNNILQKIKHEAGETVELNAQLKQMQHEQVYHTPVNYFASLPANILSKTKETSVHTAKRVSLKPLNRVLALAAMLALFVAGFWIVQNSGSSKFDVASQIAQLSDQDIKNYISENSFNFNESTLLEATGNVDDDLFLDIDIKQEDLDFYLNDFDLTL